MARTATGRTSTRAAKPAAKRAGNAKSAVKAKRAADAKCAASRSPSAISVKVGLAAPIEGNTELLST